ncbi:MAG: FAD-dependent oxidoreductase [Lachnospiraceae bacterium]|nr:FAD-dependent oxidoreductase [Lachnospiraceae bacterium]
MERCDVLVLGAGPGGLAAAAAAKKAGAERAVLIDRDVRAGGILNQCIHDGFGLIRYGASISGPEYAAKALAEAEAAGVTLRLGLQAVSMTAQRTLLAQGKDGLVEFQAGSIVLATGCRERTRGAISVPGSRPAGIFTAGVLQNFVNVRNILCGKRVVILGSGDIGLIMARRLTLEGAHVEAVLEVMKEPGGLARNISQCLYDFGIPLYTSHTVSNIIGKRKLEAVEVSPVDDAMRPIPGRAWTVPCDALVLSVGLIPENEVALTAGVAVDEKGRGALTDEYLMTNLPGVFACGNCRKVMDLADYVSNQGTLAGENAAHFVQGEPLRTWNDRESSGMVKGLPAPGSVTCPICPNGCQIVIDPETGAVSGNRCPRGLSFAEQERIRPMRTLTTTLRVEGGPVPLVSVRSDRAIPRDDLQEAARRLKACCVRPPIRLGDCLAELEAGGVTVRMLAGEDVL